MVSGKNEDTGPLFVPELYAAGKLSQNRFSFYMTNDYDVDDCPTCQSYIDFGEPDTSIIGS